MPKHRHPLRDSFHFLAKFVRRPFRVGALWPSSRRLAEAMVKDVRLVPGDVVVEYGPGTGPMTAVLARKVNEGVRYVGIERDRGFHELLKKRFPKLAFELGSAEDVAAILEARGLPQPKLIISGLPFASMPKDLQERIVAATKSVLRSDGTFRTFAYVHAYRSRSAKRFREFMADQFARFECSRAVLLNVPPAYVLSYQP